jgi:hypothetical protein
LPTRLHFVDAEGYLVLSLLITLRAKMYLNIGIDVSKNKHDACILNENGEQIGKFMKLTNTKTSLDKFLEQIKIIGTSLNLGH